MNIVLIVIDSLREDFSKPFWNLLKKKNFTKYSAISPSFWTIPSHASMFTGLYPSAHGVHATRNKKYLELRFKGQNIVDELREKEFQINWFTANAWVSPAFGFPKPDKLFIPKEASGQRIIPLTEEEDRFKMKRLVGLSRKEKVKKLIKTGKFKLLWKLAINYGFNKLNQKTNRKWPFEKGGKAILEEIKKTKFEEPHFTFINLMEVHEPYEKFNISTLRSKSGLPATIDFRVEDERKIRKQLYDEYHKEIEYEVKLLEKLVNQFPNDLVIVTSDHGQILGEREVLFHVWGLYDELVRVPLFVKYPEKIEHAKEKKVVSLTRIFSLIKKASEKNLKNDEFLYGRAFSEMFGPYLKYFPKTNDQKEILSLKEKRMVAVFERETKLVYNLTDNKVFEFHGNEDLKQELIESSKFFVEN